MGTFVLPGQSMIPKKYGESMVLYTAGDPVATVVDGAEPGPDGRLFKIEPGKAKKVPYEAGRFILEHLAYTGVVRVDEKETAGGIEYDIEGAKAASLVLLAEQDQTRFNRFVSDMVDDYIKRSKPVPQPPPPIMAIIQRRGYDLGKYGIIPIGWEKPENDTRVADLEKHLADLKGQMASLGAAHTRANAAEKELADLKATLAKQAEAQNELDSAQEQLKKRK